MFSRLIDIHTHILPDVDDGAGSLEEALRMAALACENGTEYLVLTPHVGGPGDSRGNEWSRRTHMRYKAFREAVVGAGIPLKIGYGAEIFATDRLWEQLSAGQLLPLAGSHYLLIEFPFDTTPAYVRDALSAVSRAGLIPVMAHPERYRLTAEDPRAIFDWVQSGCIMQLNKDSLLGRFGRQIRDAAHLLLRHRLAHCIASDAHHADHRTPDLAVVYRYVEETAGTETANILLRENPGRLVADRKILASAPIPF